MEKLELFVAIILHISTLISAIYFIRAYNHNKDLSRGDILSKLMQLAGEQRKHIEISGAFLLLLLIAVVVYWLG